MKTIALFSAAFAWAAAGAMYGADAPKSPWAGVSFDHPEKFTDIQDQLSPTEQGQQAILDNIREFLVSESKRFIPEGCQLSITFTDIELAGKFEPWRGPKWDQVRIIEPVYPPRFRFTWSVTDSAGKVVKQGKEDIRDTAFYLRVMIDKEDPLRFEKDILKDWVSGSLGNVKRLVASN
jgi:hypothetical protein